LRIFQSISTYNRLIRVDNL